MLLEGTHARMVLLSAQSWVDTASNVRRATMAVHARVRSAELTGANVALPSPLPHLTLTSEALVEGAEFSDHTLSGEFVDLVAPRLEARLRQVRGVAPKATRVL